MVNGTLNRAYDAFNRSTGYVLLDSTTPPNAVTAATYNYDTTGNFSQIQGDTIPASLASGISTTALVPSAFTYSRITNSSLLASVTGPAHTVTNTYESNRDVLIFRQNKITVGANTNAIASQYDYTINAIGQRTVRSQSGIAFTTASTDSFSYNTRGEVITSANNQNSILNRAFNYDPIGNRLTATDGTGSTAIAKTYSSNLLNQYTQIQTTPPVPPMTSSLAYDDDGNMLSDGTGKIYGWDCENRLIQVTLPNGEFVKNYYDAQSRRVKHEHITTVATGTTTYLHDGWNVLILTCQQKSLN